MLREAWSQTYRARLGVPEISDERLVLFLAGAELALWALALVGVAVGLSALALVF